MHDMKQSQKKEKEKNTQECRVPKGNHILSEESHKTELILEKGKKAKLGGTT